MRSRDPSLAFLIEELFVLRGRKSSVLYGLPVVESRRWKGVRTRESSKKKRTKPSIKCLPPLQFIEVFAYFHEYVQRNNLFLMNAHVSKQKISLYGTEILVHQGQLSTVIGSCCPGFSHRGLLPHLLPGPLNWRCKGLNPSPSALKSQCCSTKPQAPSKTKCY